MKKLKLLVLAVLFSPTLMWAQSEGINYQAAVRDGSGVLISNQAVASNFKVRQGSAAGTIVYEEDQNPMSNDYGLINVVIGEGNVVSGTFNTIDWGADTYFLDITIDGTNIGAFEFKSVPYAHHANSLTNVKPNTANSDVEITSTDAHAVLSIVPNATVGNDSSTVFFGEGTNMQNGMTITYDGVSNVMRFAGKTAAYPYMGPFLTISRDSGISTFTKGVAVQETTDTPTPNTIYGNSGPLAYGHIIGATTATISTDFGLASVTTMGTGFYQITLDNSWVGNPVVVASSLNNSQDTEVVTYSTSGSNIINVRIVDENNAAIHSNFSIIVYGIAQ